MFELETSDRPPPAGPSLRIERLSAAQAMTCCFLGQKVEWILTHWQPAKGAGKGWSVPHNKEKENCDGCKRELPSRWRGFACVIDMEKHVKCFLEITPGCQQDLDMVFGKEAPLRGEVCKIRRMQGDQARLKLEMLACWSRRTDKPLAAFSSVIPVLEELWQRSKDKGKA